MNRTGSLLTSLSGATSLPNNASRTSIITPLTRRLFALPPIPASPSPSHTSLSTFLAYASRISLPESTTTYQGTLYEYTVQTYLRNSGFSLHRVGGRSDLGVDLTGTWHVGEHPVTDPPVRVIVQCKSLKGKLGPSVVREVEGVAGRFVRARPSGRKGEGSGGAGYAGVLVSPREATRGVREALGRSRMPLVWMMLGWDGVLRQVLWNSRVEALGGGLGGLGVETVYRSGLQLRNGTESDFGSDEAKQRQEVRLMWEGKEVETMDKVEDGMKRAERDWMAKWEEREFRDIPAEDILDAVERFVPGARPITISDEEREMVVKALLPG
ncbi:hypothetical protein BJY01DRAFT_104130 [Aspergillus pseudoustus]|uniref:Restriction endonuclease type IV Mrr domain-containing protein n=1 Tax=Aspergillus pseudoustus TaxID=1810923 RepID=A0ABR4KI92_9EURO